jgi:hypothetical protein
MRPLIGLGFAYRAPAQAESGIVINKDNSGKNS